MGIFILDQKVLETVDSGARVISNRDSGSFKSKSEVSERHSRTRPTEGRDTEKPVVLDDVGKYMFQYPITPLIFFIFFCPSLYE